MDAHFFFSPYNSELRCIVLLGRLACWKLKDAGEAICSDARGCWLVHLIFTTVHVLLIVAGMLFWDWGKFILETWVGHVASWTRWKALWWAEKWWLIRWRVLWRLNGTCCTRKRASAIARVHFPIPLVFVLTHGILILLRAWQRRGTEGRGGLAAHWHHSRRITHVTGAAFARLVLRKGHVEAVGSFGWRNHGRGWRSGWRRITCRFCWTSFNFLFYV